MPKGPAARIMDPTMHPLPPGLMPGPPSINVIIGKKPAWKGLPAGAGAALQAAQAAMDVGIKAAEAASIAAAPTPGAPAAKAAELATKTAAVAAFASMVASVPGVSIHMCATFLPPPPHGPGVVIDGSQTVLINNMSACRLGDTVLEALGPNKIVMGEMTVIIGG